MPLLSEALGAEVGPQTRSLSGGGCWTCGCCWSGHEEARAQGWLQPQVLGPHWAGTCVSTLQLKTRWVKGQGEGPEKGTGCIAGGGWI